MSCVFEFRYTTGLFWIQLAIVIFITFVFVQCFYVNLINPKDGEMVIITPENTVTVNEKIDRLHEIAVFPCRVVRWHMVFFGSLFGSLISLAIFRSFQPTSKFSQWATIAAPTFALTYIATGFWSYHAPYIKHAKDATKLRVALAQQIRE